jgi:DNA-binding NarL/FixJ family response regulator
MTSPSSARVWRCCSTPNPDIEVVGAAADGREAVRLALQLRPEVGLFDIRMPLMDGIEATRRLAGPDVADPLPIVVITTFDLDEYVHGALKAGARGILAQGRRTRPADPGDTRCCGRKTH